MTASKDAKPDGIATRCQNTGEATYWDIEDIQFHCRIGRTTAWRLARNDDQFPNPVVLGSRNLIWPRTEVVAFFEARRQPNHYSGRKNAPTGIALPDHEREVVCVPRPLRPRQQRQQDA
jgi:predicted DNA-binding transcriptional regulator AlpA